MKKHVSKMVAVLLLSVWAMCSAFSVQASELSGKYDAQGEAFIQSITFSEQGIALQVKPIATPEEMEQFHYWYTFNDTVLSSKVNPNASPEELNELLVTLKLNYGERIFKELPQEWLKTTSGDFLLNDLRERLTGVFPTVQVDGSVVFHLHNFEMDEKDGNTVVTLFGEKVLEVAHNDDGTLVVKGVNYRLAE